MTGAWPAPGARGLTAVIVGDHDPAIDFFVSVLGFELVEDSTAVTGGAHAKRWAS